MQPPHRYLAGLPRTENFWYWGGGGDELLTISLVWEDVLPNWARGAITVTHTSTST